MKTLKVVSRIKINGEWVLQTTLSQEKGKKVIEAKVDEVMKNMGFKRERPPKR